MAKSGNKLWLTNEWLAVRFLTENANFNLGCLSGIQWATSAQAVSTANKCLCFWTRFTSFWNGVPGAGTLGQTRRLLDYRAAQREVNSRGSHCGRALCDREHCQPHLVSYVISNTVHGNDQKKEEKLTEWIVVIINEVAPPPPPADIRRWVMDVVVRGWWGRKQTENPPGRHPCCCHNV